jgi:hypothetical protein
VARQTHGLGWIFLALAWALCLVAGCGRTSQPRPIVPTATAVLSAAPAIDAAPRTLLDEHFLRTWPNDPRGTAWFSDANSIPSDGGRSVSHQSAYNAYNLFARQPGQFVAIRAPIADVPADVTVSGTFHKVGGPPGGGYGLIVRDQSIGAGDGIDQNGQFLVAEVGDRGEVGIWQRADSHWIDLVPWTPSPLVHPGNASNELKVELAGNRLHFDVNGSQAADVEVGFSGGSVGLFVGGDLNQVQLDRLLVQAAPAEVRQATAGARAPAPASPSAPDIPAARTRLNALAARAKQDSSVMQDTAWRQDMGATLAGVEQIAGKEIVSAATDPSAPPDTRGLRSSLGGIADNMVAILDAFGSDVNGTSNPLTSPRALDQAARQLDSAVSQANTVLAQVEAARAADQSASSTP